MCRLDFKLRVEHVIGVLVRWLRADKFSIVQRVSSVENMARPTFKFKNPRTRFARRMDRLIVGGRVIYVDRIIILNRRKTILSKV